MQARDGDLWAPRVAAACQYATFELMKATGASWPQAHRDAKQMAALAAGGARVFGFESVRVPFGQTGEAEAFGAVINDGGGESLPSIASHPCTIDSPPAFPADFLSRGPLPAQIEAVGLLAREFSGEVLVAGGVCGPVTIAAALLGIAPFLRAAQKTPDLVRPFLALGVEAASAIAASYAQAGADVLVVEDMMASMSMISPRLYKNLAFEYEKALVERVRPRLPVVLHICGKLDAVLPEVLATGASALSVESPACLAAAKGVRAAVGGKTVLLGAVDPVETLRGGTPEDVEAAVRASLEAGADVVAPGCALAPDTPTENVLAMTNFFRRGT